ncbi:MAG: ATP-binding protein, partial [Mucinivorans sp.]
MTQTEKEQIRSSLQGYITRFDSQNQASASLTGVSAATVIQIIKGNWDKIAEQMWRNVASQIGYQELLWPVVQTRCYKMLTQVFCDAQRNSNVYAITAMAG